MDQKLARESENATKKEMKRKQKQVGLVSVCNTWVDSHDMSTVHY